MVLASAPVACLALAKALSSAALACSIIEESRSRIYAKFMMFLLKTY